MKTNDDQRQIDQLYLNQKWLIAQMDKVHAILCPNQDGGWIKRMEQVVAAAEKLKQR